MESLNQSNQIGISQTFGSSISHHRNYSKPSRWKWIIILDSVTKEYVQYYPLDDNARIISKMKRQKRRSLGKMTGKKGVPKNKHIAYKKFKKMFPNECTTYEKREKSTSDSTILMKDMHDEQMTNIENQSENQVKMLSNIGTDSNVCASQNQAVSAEYSDCSNDKNKFKFSIDLSSLDWLLNECY